VSVVLVVLVVSVVLVWRMRFPESRKAAGFSRRPLEV
jgi:hypothetical protein